MIWPPGLNRTMVAIELRRILRNRRGLVFTIVMPPVFFVLFGGGHGNTTQRVGSGNVTAYVLVGMAVYGAMLTSTSTGASVSLERAAGWTRQLRLTPLHPGAYVMTKLIAALAVSLLSVTVVYAIGSASGAAMPASVWLATFLLAWLASMVFAAFGLFMGYLLPSDNVMQVIGPALALMSFAGGLFLPLSQMSPVLRAFAKVTPVYGVGELARTPLVHHGQLIQALLNVAVWTLIFGAGAAWRFRRDTARV